MLMESLYKASIIYLWFSSMVEGKCPSSESIPPCTCISIKDGISVECKGPKNADLISSVISNLENTRNLELVLESLTLPSLPLSVKHVTSLHLHGVHVLQNNASSTWSKLTEVIVESSSISGSAWPYFREAWLLKHLEISKIDVPTIGLGLKEIIPIGLTYLDVRKTKTTTIESGALNHLKKLQYFIMVDVPLQEFPRDTLPQQMPELYTFILGNTKIEKLEENFFQGMSKLEIIMLNGNRLTTLDYGSFAPVEHQLTHLLAERNLLICDCSLTWLSNIQNKRSMKVLATCIDRASGERKEVTALEEQCS